MRWLSGLVIAPGMVPSSSHAARTDGPKRLPLRDFFRNPEQTAHQVSPDGNHISYAAPYERRLNVFVRPTAGGAATRVTAETERDISGYFWKGQRIVFVKDFGGDENFHVVSIDLTGERSEGSHPRRDACRRRSSTSSRTTTITSSCRTIAAIRRCSTSSAST